MVVPSALLAELGAAGHRRTIDEALFSRDGKMEELLQITGREKASVRNSWRATRQAVRGLETASAVSETMDDGSFQITLPDLSTARERVGDQFVSSLKGILGENRGEAFLAGKQVNQVFGSHAGERRYLVAPEETGDGGWRFRMTLEDLDGRRVWVGETIPQELQHLLGAIQLVSDGEPE